MATESRFTKGPWHVAPSNAEVYAEGCSIVEGQNGFGVRAAPGVCVEEDEAADLQLIAAAPELVGALQLVASKTVLTSGIRAVIDAALIKAGVLLVDAVEDALAVGRAA